jgi:hypothetical protein
MEYFVVRCVIASLRFIIVKQPLAFKVPRFNPAKD